MCQDIINDDVTFSEAEEIAKKWADDCSSDNANEARAKKALVALQAYANKSYGDSSDESVEEALKDLLGDARHLADRLNINVLDVSDRALNTYLGELQ